MFNQLFTYSKFIYQKPEILDKGVEKRGGVDVELARRREKAEHHLEKKKKRLDKLAKRVKEHKNGLLDRWIENNPQEKIEVHEASPKTLALKQISSKKRAKEMYLLLSFVEEIWNSSKAYQIYLKCRQRRKAGKDVSFTPVENLFSKKNAKDLGIGFFYEKGKWWAYDTDGSHEAGKNYLVDSLRLFEKEFVKDKAVDSGFINKEKGKKYFKMMQKLPIEAMQLIEQKSKKREKLIKWIKKNTQKKWKALPKDMRTIASLIYGYEYGGKFLYRYFPKLKRIVAVKIENAKLRNPDEAGIAFYLDEKEKFKNVNVIKDEDELRKNLKEVIDEMSSEEVLSELIALRDERGEKLPDREVVSLVRSVVGKNQTLFNSKKISYAEIKDGRYEDVLKKKIEKQLKKDIENKENVKKYSRIAAAEYLKEIKSEIDNLENIEDLMRETKPEKLEFNINFDTKGNISSVEVTGKATSILQEIKGASDTIESKITNVRGAISQRIKKIFPGFLGGVAAWLAQSFFSDEDLKKWINSDGQGGGFTGLAMKWLGLGGAGAGALASGLLLKSKKLDSREFDKYLDKLLDKEKKGNTVKLDKGIELKEETTLSNKKIVIPKSVVGKFRPKRAKGFSFLVNGEVKKWEPQKQEKKTGASSLGFLSGLFGGGKKEKIEGEVTIPKETKIPKGTYIPKKSKISRIT